jgi:orotate phosphoribosyltransferase
VLLVDDTSNHGRAMARAVETIRHRAKQITRLAIFGPYQVEEPAKIVDLWFEDCRGPRAFEWNILKHARLRRWAFDFDGVLCRDPTSHENDDGPLYKAFLRDAEPLLLPTRPIGPIITCRLEKYRSECEEWLARHGIEYASLTMMPYASKAERMEAGGRGAWKAERFAESGADMMIESCPKQAGIIAKRTGKPVWCAGTQSLV